MQEFSYQCSLLLEKGAHSRLMGHGRKVCEPVTKNDYERGIVQLLGCAWLAGHWPGIHKTLDSVGIAAETVCADACLGLQHLGGGSRRIRSSSSSLVT